MTPTSIYALVIKGTVDIQGMVALSGNKDLSAVYVAWMCASPNNNPMLTDQKDYNGVGGHLFAIAVDRSYQLGYDGAITGNAADRELVDHYCDAFGADYIGMLHEFQIGISGNAAIKIKEGYSYEWTDEEI